MPTTVQSPVISGIRTSSQIFESNKVIETEDESEEKKIDDEFDYYDYYDEYDDVTSERSEEQFRSEPAPAPPRPRFSSSTFPPPEERFADIDQEDLNNFRWRPNVIRARGYHPIFYPYP